MAPAMPASASIRSKQKRGRAPASSLSRPSWLYVGKISLHRKGGCSLWRISSAASTSRRLAGASYASDPHEYFPTSGASANDACVSATDLSLILLLVYL